MVRVGSASSKGHRLDTGQGLLQPPTQLIRDIPPRDSKESTPSPTDGGGDRLERHFGLSGATGSPDQSIPLALDEFARDLLLKRTEGKRQFDAHIPALCRQLVRSEWPLV